MKLKDWLSDTDTTYTDFGARIGRTGEAVRRYALGQRIPDRETMPQIVDATDGRVTANDFFDISPAADHADSDTTGAAASSSGKAGDISAQVVPA